MDIYVAAALEDVLSNTPQEMHFCAMLVKQFLLRQI
jgi:hypothetical protein